MEPLRKELYAAGLQCTRRLWQQVREPGRARPLDPATRARLAEGTEIGRGARARFPGGVLIAEPDPDAAVLETQPMLLDPQVPAIFEAAFEHERVRVRVDVLERLPSGGFGIREVKAASSMRPQHLDDVVLQLWVLRGAGVRVESVELLLVDPAYRGGEGGLDWARFIQRRDVSEEADFLVDDVPARLHEQRSALAGAEPEVAPSPHCRRPRLCPFWEHCTEGLPSDWIGRLPGMRSAEFQALWSEDLRRIPEIPEAFPLKPRQSRARAAHRAARTVVAPGLAQALAGTGPPALYLDFEATSAARPRFPGLAPFQAIPYQWSLHAIDADGEQRHAEFLAREPGDPRPAFAESLLAALESDPAPVLVYSSYEETVLRELAGALPALGPRTDALIARLVDLLPVVRDHVYDPAFSGSFSIKSVAPALAPSFSYDGLEGVADGGQASVAIDKLLSGALDPRAEARLREDLLAYCERDTLALVELHRALRALAERG